ncbi:uncharacterized protein B0H18DRAFT_1211254 [Fomitopsis serialis]|uniref:uncharacterized protein n=1 Tax=Fomitopsis serialis TaxID=139415 RepID=UPI002008A686|nr:uncharacterized protein B0H18DRAFT_1211254 [Neoantrodia serialis]KAH9926002.1 hypothetical protein B0H18DRAFT_1211254 [Neoantrodia serialis]
MTDYLLPFTIQDAASTSHAAASTQPANDHSDRTGSTYRQASSARTNGYRTDAWHEDTRGTALAGCIPSHFKLHPTSPLSLGRSPPLTIPISPPLRAAHVDAGQL